MTQISRWAPGPVGRAICVAAALSGTLGAAATFRLDGLLAINDAPSPCTSVQVKVFGAARLSSVVAVSPDGQVTPLAKTAPLPRFEKGKTYTLQATCLGAANVFQNSEMTFKAEGRTVMVVFTKGGFQFRRGGLAY